MFRFLLVALVAAAAIPDGKAISFDATLSGSAMPAVSFSKTNQAFEPVIFSAVRASEKSRKSVSRLAFDNTVTDIGYGWNPKRSEFVCFYPGSYFFSFTAISDSTSNFKIALMKNNDEMVYAWGDRIYQSGSNSVVLSLEKNDRVYLSIQEGAIHETRKIGRGYTSFSGFRIN